MTANALSGEGNLDLKAMIVRLNVGDYLSLPHILIIKLQRRFFSQVFPIYNKNSK